MPQKKQVVMEFSGWAVLAPNTQMELVDTDPVAQPITVEEWMSLPEEQQELYMLSDFAQAMRDSLEYAFEELRLAHDEYTTTKEM
jgi:hypothetical protein